MDRKRLRNTKREKIHQAMKLKQSARYDWLRGTWEEMVLHCQQLKNIQNNILRGSENASYKT